MMIFIALATAAFAAEPRHEVSLELGTHNSDSPAWGVIDSNSSNTIGIRGGYGINSRLTAIGSWHVGQIVTDHSSNSNDYYYEEPVHGSSGLNGGVYSSLLVNHLSAGAKISNQIQPWLVPYATVQGLVSIGSFSITDDLDDDESLINVSDSALGLGGVLSVGAELRAKPVNGASWAGHLEFGYGLTTEMAFALEGEGDSSASIGGLGYKGLSVRAGVGLRF